MCCCFVHAVRQRSKLPRAELRVCLPSPPPSGGVSRSSDLRGDSEHLALWDHAAARQLPPGGHAPQLHQLRLPQRRGGGARRPWASGTRSSDPRQEIQHVRRPTTGPLRAPAAHSISQRWGTFRLNSPSLPPSVFTPEFFKHRTFESITPRVMQVKMTSLHNLSYEIHTIRAQILFRADSIFIISIFQLQFWTTGVVVDVWILLPSLKRVLMRFIIRPFPSLLKLSSWLDKCGLPLLAWEHLGYANTAVSMATTTALLHLFWRWNNGTDDDGVTFMNWIWTLAPVRSIKQTYTCIYSYSCPCSLLLC